MKGGYYEAHIFQVYRGALIYRIHRNGTYAGVCVGQPNRAVNGL